MINLILKTLDTIKDGFLFQKNNKKELYYNYLQPAMKDFEIVHENYLDSFKSYIAIIKDDPLPLNKKHPIWNMVSNDSLFSRNMRQKVYSYFDYSQNEEFQNFNKSLIEYFDYENFPYNPDIATYNYRPIKSNNSRLSFVEDLVTVIKYNDFDNRRELAIYSASNLIEIMQSNYIKVINEYNSLKNQLLN